jgi:hypothetical protein
VAGLRQLITRSWVELLDGLPILALNRVIPRKSRFFQCFLVLLSQLDQSGKLFAVDNACCACSATVNEATGLAREIGFADGFEAFLVWVEVKVLEKHASFTIAGTVVDWKRAGVGDGKFTRAEPPSSAPAVPKESK